MKEYIESFRPRQMSKLLFEFMLLSDLLILHRCSLKQRLRCFSLFIWGLLMLGVTSSPPPPLSCPSCPVVAAEFPLTHHLKMH